MASGPILYADVLKPESLSLRGGAPGTNHRTGVLKSFFSQILAHALLRKHKHFSIAILQDSDRSSHQKT